MFVLFIEFEEAVKEKKEEGGMDGWMEGRSKRGGNNQASKKLAIAIAKNTSASVLQEGFDEEVSLP